jgi:membrane protein DedA with SNARE-associated domain
MFRDMIEALHYWPQVASEWMPVWKPVGFFFATFILEDVAAVGAGLLLASGQISWPAAFLSCFLGIWLGDVGLYALARKGGRHWFERSALKRFAGRVAQSERWFAKRGTPILIFSRLVPGARLPTYLAAGFLRVPFPHFLLVTGAASFVWTLAILRLAELFGVRLLNWLNAYKLGGLTLLAVGAGLVGLLQIIRRVVLRMDLTRLARLRHWEFWPAWMFYPPVAVYCLWLAVKYRGLTLPMASNPGIFSGGLVGESKIAMLTELSKTSPEFTAPAVLVWGATPEERLSALEEGLARLKIDFPFILKPDVGQRGAGVKLICQRDQAEAYLRQTSAALVVQRYAPGPFEVGVFYYRFPHEVRGRIFAITEKIFPVITGDGRSTVAELIKRDARAGLIADVYLKRFHVRRDEILAAGEQLRLVESGNHAQGCIFCDGGRLGTTELEARIDEISQKVTGFFIGRYDIRFANEDDLRTGRDFQIIELNGAASEATSIYDAQNSLGTAYRTLFRQWDLVFAIGAANRRRGASATSVPQVWQAWRSYSAQAATYPAAD